MTTPAPSTTPALAGGPGAVLERWEWLDAVQAPGSGVSASARHLACLMARVARDARCAWLPLASAAEQMGRTLNTARTAFRELEGSGWLTRVCDPSQHRAARYALTTPRGATTEPLAATSRGAMTELENVRGATTAPLSESRGATTEPLAPVDDSPRGATTEPLGNPEVQSTCPRGATTAPEHISEHNFPSPYVGTSPARETGDHAPTAGDPPTAVATRSTDEEAGPHPGGHPTSPVVAAVTRHRTTAGLKADPAMLAAPLIARGWTAAHVTRLLDSLPADAGPGRAVKALRDAATTPPPATSRHRAARCPDHDRELTADGTCGLCRSEQIAARTRPTRVPVMA